MTPSFPPFRLRRRRTLPRPGDIPSEVGPPILVGFLWYPVMRFRSLQTCTSAVLSTSHEAPRGSLVARTFGCQLSRIGVLSCALGSVAWSFRRLDFEPLGFICCREHFARCSFRSSGNLRKQRSGMWVVKPFLMQSGKMQVPRGARFPPGLDVGLAVRRASVWAGPRDLAFSFRISANFVSLKMLLARSVFPVTHSDSMVETKSEYSSPIPVRRPAFRIMASPLADSSQSVGIMLHIAVQVKDSIWELQVARSGVHDARGEGNAGQRFDLGAASRTSGVQVEDSRPTTLAPLVLVEGRGGGAVQAEHFRYAECMYS